MRWLAVLLVPAIAHGSPLRHYVEVPDDAYPDETAEARGWRAELGVGNDIGNLGGLAFGLHGELAIPLRARRARHRQISDSWFSVSVPVLSAHSTSMLAASSMADNRMIKTPRRPSSIDPTAMLTVNITGSAIGTALMSSTSVTGRTSTSRWPWTSAVTNVTTTSVPTITSNHVTIREVTSSTLSLGCARSTSWVVRPK